MIEEISGFLLDKGFTPEEDLSFRRSDSAVIQRVSIVLGTSIRSGRLMLRLSLGVVRGEDPLHENTVVVRDLHQLVDDLGSSDWYEIEDTSGKGARQAIALLVRFGLPWLERYQSAALLIAAIERGDFRTHRVEKTLSFGRKRIETITKELTEPDLRALSHLHEALGNIAEAIRFWRLLEPIAVRSSERNRAAWKTRLIHLEQLV